MTALALLAPLIVQVAAPAFAPPLDRPITYSVGEVREDGKTTRRFGIDRHVTFRRAGDGYVAEVETLAVTGDAGVAGRMFQGMARAMLARRVILHLDNGGRVIDVADADAVWDAQLAAMTATLKTRDPARAAVSETLLAPLRSLPRTAKVSKIGEMIAPLIPAAPIRPAPQRVITLPARAQDGSTAMLAGTERTVAQPDGMLLLERQASGIVSGATTSVTLRRRIDPRTGLIVETVNIDTNETGGTRQIVTRTLTTKP